MFEKIPDDQFVEFVSSPQSEEALRIAYIDLEEKLAALWNVSKEDYYYRDKYDREALIITRLRMVKQALVWWWQGTGQVV